jgi:4-hydroxy-4-methyl-2-oxoglutarate aldolase
MVDASMRDQLKSLGTSTLYEAQGRHGAFPPAIRPVWKGAFVAGPAFTVRVRPGDNLALHHAVALASPGNVLVVDCGGYADSGVWGEVLSVAAKHRGIAGLIVDGSVRDIERIEALGFPVFSRGVSMGGTSKDDAGTLGGTLSFGSLGVTAGDMVVGDGDGVVAIAASEFDTVLNAAIDREEREQVMMRALGEGKLTIELMDLRPPSQQGTTR